MMPNLDLNRFMVFNYSKGHKGLIYHWVKEIKVTVTEQIDDICLCHASINVSQLFQEDDKPKQTSGQKRGLALRFEKTLVSIVEVDPTLSIWMAAHVIPMDDDLPIDAIERFISNIYDRFCLLNGTFNNENISEEYFNKVLQDVHLDSIISNIGSLYNYVLYLDINPLTLMKVNSFINHLVSIDAEKIRHTIVIFNDQLLWSSLGMNDTRLLYNYLVSVLIRAALQEELSTEVEKVRKIEENIPVRLSDNDPNYMTVFRSSNNMTLGIILMEPDQNDLTQKLGVGVIPLASLAQTVGQNFLSSHPQTNQNSQQHIAIRYDSIQQSCTKESRFLKYFIELEPELRNIHRQYGSLVVEFYGKTSNDSWLTVTNSKYKSIYSVHNARNSTLTEADQSASNMRLSFASSRP